MKKSVQRVRVVSTRATQRPAPNGGKTKSDSLRDSVTEQLEQYYERWQGDEDPFGVLRMLMREIEPAVITATLKYTKGNKSRAARILGLNRSSLDSKLRTYGIADQWRRR